MDARRGQQGNSVDAAASTSALDRPQKTQNLTIAGNFNDGCIEGDTLYPSGENPGAPLEAQTLFAGWWGVYNWIYLRFVLSDTLAAGSAIENTELRLWGAPASGQTAPPNFRLAIYAELSGNAAPITDALEAPDNATTGRPITRAVVLWPEQSPPLAPAVGEWNRTPNLAALLQELIDGLGELRAGSALQFFFRGAESTGAPYSVGFADSSRSTPHPAQLDIVWR